MIAKIIILIVACNFALFESFKIKQHYSHRKARTCPDPYGKCNLGKEGMINVHIVPHTHDDVG